MGGNGNRSPWPAKVLATLVGACLIVVLVYAVQRGGLLSPQKKILARPPPIREETQVVISRDRPVAPPPSIFSGPQHTKQGMNNCLFEAVIAAGNIRSSKTGEMANPQLLRELCYRELMKHPMNGSVDSEARTDLTEAVADGNVTGGEYLPVLSKLLNVEIHVDIPESPDWQPGPIMHDDKLASDPTVPVIHITHLGNMDHGHWVPARGRCPNRHAKCVG